MHRILSATETYIQHRLTQEDLKSEVEQRPMIADILLFGKLFSLGH